MLGRDYPHIALKKSDGYFADFFSGSGGVARAVRAAGFSTREWELLHGEDYDLTKPSFLSKIREDIRNGKIFAAMLAPPCSSFSPARDRTRVIRTREHPWGLQGLPKHEVAKVQIGDKCFRSAFKIVKWLDEAGIPWILENPHSSKCWYLPPLVNLSQAPRVRVNVCDFCQYGTQWRKRTRFLSGNLAECDLGRIQRRCHGKPGWCSRSGTWLMHLRPIDFVFHTKVQLNTHEKQTTGNNWRPPFSPFPPFVVGSH